MNKQLPEQQKYDPWEAKQEIMDLKVIVHCSRYWMLSEWECNNMSFPFCRLYHSQLGGATVSFEGKESGLTSDKIILIPPYTSFSSKLNNTYKTNDESIKGVKIQYETEIDSLGKAGMTDQFFVHFNLGFPYDKVKPGIYEISTNQHIDFLVKKAEIKRLQEPDFINFKANISIVSLILNALDYLPENIWDIPTIDKRILKIVNYIDKHIAETLTNSDLCAKANLAVNSFARLFKENMNKSVQNYVQERRIEHAVLMIHHSNWQIDEIAEKCGFYDRHHFSKIFKKYTGMPPVYYRQKLSGKIERL